jgi:hypothetical protein
MLQWVCSQIAVVVFTDVAVGVFTDIAVGVIVCMREVCGGMAIDETEVC